MAMQKVKPYGKGRVESSGLGWHRMIGWHIGACAAAPSVGCVDVLGW